MHSRAYLFLAICIAVAVADDVNCWGSGTNAAGIACNVAVKRYDRVRVHTLLIAPNSPPGANQVVFSAIHFPNVDGQPPGKLSQLQFRGSFSQITGCSCPDGNCENLLKACACASSTCSVSEVAACRTTWMAAPNSLCAAPVPPPTPTPPSVSSMTANTFLQMSFGATQASLDAGTNTLRNSSASADGAIGMPGWVFVNPNLPIIAPPAPVPLYNYAFANNKALTALVQIDQGKFSFAEWNWDKADTRCKSNAAPGTPIYTNVLLNPCGANTANPCINNLVCGVTFDYCLLSMIRTNTKANPGIVSPECDLVISLAWQGTDANKRYCQSQNQMFSKFNAMGLNNLIQDSLSRGNDITSDIESKLKNAGR